MQSKSRKPLFMTALAMAMLMSFNSHAVVVLPGDTSVPLSGTTTAAEPDRAGPVIFDQLIPFSIRDGVGNVILTGNYQDRVIRSDNTGTLLFEPRLKDLVNASGDAWIVGLQTTGFGGFSTDINYMLDSLGDVGPDSVSKDTAGDDILFSHGVSIILPPNESYFYSTLTDATNFDRDGKATIYASNDFGGPVYRTVLEDRASPSVIPVPAAVWLFGSGLLGLIGIARRSDTLS